MLRTQLKNKALYRAAMGYVKRGRSIINGMLVEKLLGLVERLKETKGMRLFKFNLRGDLNERLRCSKKEKGILKVYLSGRQE